MYYIFSKTRTLAKWVVCGTIPCILQCYDKNFLLYSIANKISRWIKLKNIKYKYCSSIPFHSIRLCLFSRSVLTVLSKALLPPDNSSETTLYEDQKPNYSSRNHNYTDCCISKNVSSGCLGFCNIQSILEGIFIVQFV